MVDRIRKEYQCEFFALWANSKIYVCSKGWRNLHYSDVYMLDTYRNVHANSAVFTDIPIYLTHTALTEDLKQVAYIPFRYIIMTLSPIF